jgi:hypothetical protein
VTTNFRFIFYITRVGGINLKEVHEAHAPATAPKAEKPLEVVPEVPQKKKLKSEIKNSFLYAA